MRFCRYGEDPSPPHIPKARGQREGGSHSGLFAPALAGCRIQRPFGPPHPDTSIPPHSNAFLINGLSELACPLEEGGLVWFESAHVEQSALHRGGSMSTGN